MLEGVLCVLRVRLLRHVCMLIFSNSYYSITT
jgi:hypothetical protein